MTREEIINTIWERMQLHNTETEEADALNLMALTEKCFIKAFECKAILNAICTPAELRKLHEGGKV